MLRQRDNRATLRFNSLSDHQALSADRAALGMLVPVAGGDVLPDQLASLLNRCLAEQVTALVERLTLGGGVETVGADGVHPRWGDVQKQAL